MTLKKYKELIKDTLQYLHDLDISYLISNQETLSFFKNDILLAVSKPKTQKILPPVIKVVEKPKIETPIVASKPLLPPSPIEKKPINLSKEAPIELKKEEKKSLNLDPKIENHVQETNLEEFKKIFLKISPSLIVEAIPDDKKAKQKALTWKLKSNVFPLTILAFKENEKTYKFLTQLAKALDLYFYPAKVISAYNIEKENEWEMFLSSKDLKLIISPDYIISEMPNLRKNYKEYPQKRLFFLKDVPLFILPDINIYLKEPLLKPSLFKTLKQKIVSLEAPHE
jgi:hypothetical protein